jgi:hypothetical protein
VYIFVQEQAVTTQGLRMRASLSPRRDRMTIGVAPARHEHFSVCSLAEEQELDEAEFSLRAVRCCAQRLAARLGVERHLVPPLS